MNSIFTFPTLVRSALGVLLLQGLAISPAAAREGDARVPSSVSALDATAHKLTETYQAEIRSGRPGPHREAQHRFLEAARDLEASSHTLRDQIAARESVRRLEGSIAGVRSSLNRAASAGREVRMSDRTRDLLFQARSLVTQVEEQRRQIYAMSSSNNDHGDRGDRGRDDRNGRDDDRKGSKPTLGQTLDRILGR